VYKASCGTSSTRFASAAQSTSRRSLIARPARSAQLACLYHERQKLYISTFKFVSLSPVFDHLAALLRVPLTIDAVITGAGGRGDCGRVGWLTTRADNGFLETSWNTYKRMMKYIRADPDRYGVQADKLHAFEVRRKPRDLPPRPRRSVH
jgi:hypothetical protein